MNIKDVRTVNSCLFEKIAVGKVFEFNNKFYMATEIIEDECHIYNTVDLYSGTMHRFNEYDIVNPVSAYITITDFNQI